MEDRVKSIEFALKNEMQERDFYLKHSQLSKDPLGKEMFATIAKDEEEHVQILKELHERLQKEGKWPEEMTVVVNDTNVEKVLEELVDKVNYSNAATADDKEAIKIAIDFEKKAADFYENLVTQAKHPDEKMIFKKLAGLERKHVGSLVQTLLYFEDPAEYFRALEHPNYEG